MRGRLSLFLVCLVLLPLRTAGAASLEKYDGIPIRWVKIEGLFPPLSSELQGGLALARRSGFKGIIGRTPFSNDSLKDDLQRIRIFLARHGYPHAHVDSRITENRDGESIDVIFEIDPGPPVFVREIIFSTLPPQLEERELRLELQSIVGEPLVDSKVEKDRTTILQTLREAGYAKAALHFQLENLDRDSLKILYTVDSGQRFRIGSLSLEGLSDDLVSTVHRVIHLPENEIYSLRRVNAIDWQLRQLNLFRSIRLTLVETDSMTLDFHYTLVEGDPRSLELGVGYFTDENFRISGAWQHRNLFKGGRGFRVSALYSGIESHLAASTWWPAIFSTPNTAILGLSYRIEDENSYHQVEDRFSLQSSYRPSPRITFNAGVMSSRIDLDDHTIDADATGSAKGWISRFFVYWTHDWRDDWLDAKKGKMISARMDFTPPGLGSINTFVHGELDVSRTTTITRHMRFALKGLVGAIAPLYGSDDILISQRLFAGGSRSMRGYRRRQLGPRDEAGNPLGGVAKYEASAEIRFPLWSALDAALFVDTAQVWRNWDDLFVGGVEWAAGPGLAVRTPVGPLRMDLGFRIPARHDGEPNSVFHFSVGHPF